MGAGGLEPDNPASCPRSAGNGRRLQIEGRPPGGLGGCAGCRRTPRRPPRGILIAMSRDNVEVVRGLYAELRRLTAAGGLGDLSANRALLDLLDPEVEWHGTIGGLAEGVVARGREEAARFMLEDSQEWEELIFEPMELI